MQMAMEVDNPGITQLLRELKALAVLEIESLSRYWRNGKNKKTGLGGPKLNTQKLTSGEPCQKNKTSTQTN